MGKSELTGQEKGADILGRENMGSGTDRKGGMGEDVEETGWSRGFGAYLLGGHPNLQQKEVTSICSNRKRL